MLSRLTGVVLGVMLCAARGDALPVLRFALPGNAQTLGAGASSPFINLTQEALTLERPALLTDFVRPEARILVATESTIELAGNQPYSGTSASDLRSRATYIHPMKLLKRPLTLGVSGRYEDGAFKVQNRKESLFIDIREHRSAVQFAAAWSPWERLRVGLSAGFGLGRAFGVEVTHAIGPVELGFVRRTEQLSFDFASPEGPRRRIQRPALSYGVQQTRQVGALTGALRTRWVDLLAFWDGLQGEYRLDAAVKPVRWLTLRGYADSLRYRFDEWALDEGEPILRVKMGVRISRWLVGADVHLKRHHFSLRHIQTDAATTGAWNDNGAATARRLLNVNLDFELYLRHLYRLSSQQWAVGWTRKGERWDVSAGLQHLRVANQTGGAVYGSALSNSLSGHDVIAPGVALLVGISAGVTYRIGDVQLSVSTAQLIPYGTEDPSAPSRPTPPPKPPTGTGGPQRAWYDRLSEALDKYGGGRVVSAEIRRSF